MSFSLNDFLFGSLCVEFCLYFYILSVIQFSVGVFMLISLLYMLTLGNKKVNTIMVMPVLMGSFAYFILYMQSSLFLGVCSRKEGLSCNMSQPSAKVKDVHSKKP